MRWPFAVALFLVAFAGCTSPPDESESPMQSAPPLALTPVAELAASDQMNSTVPRKEAVRLEGHMGVWACTPNPGGGCYGPALSLPDDRVEVTLNHTLTAIDLNLTWTAATPASQILRIRLACDGQPCPTEPLYVEGESPLRGTWSLRLPEGTMLRIFVQSMDVLEPYGLFMQLQDGTEFVLDGSMTFA